MVNMFIARPEHIPTIAIKALFKMALKQYTLYIFSYGVTNPGNYHVEKDVHYSKVTYLHPVDNQKYHTLWKTRLHLQSSARVYFKVAHRDIT